MPIPQVLKAYSCFNFLNVLCAGSALRPLSLDAAAPGGETCCPAPSPLPAGAPARDKLHGAAVAGARRPTGESW